MPLTLHTGGSRGRGAALTNQTIRLSANLRQLQIGTIESPLFTSEDLSLRVVVFVVATMVLVATAVPAALALAGWALGRAHYITRAKEVAPLVAPFATFGSFCVAAFVAYATWLSPFKPEVQARLFLWRMGPGAPCPFNVVVYLTVFNAGASSGTVNDFLLEIDLPNGKWVLEPFFLVKPTEFYQEALKPEIKVPFSPETIEGPFTPIFLSGRTQAAKAVSFCPGIGPGDFDIKLLEPGQHVMRLLARFNLKKELVAVSDAKIIFEPEVLANFKAGKTVINQVSHRDTNVKQLPRRK